MTLTQTQIDFFQEHGYLVLGPLLKHEEIATLRSEYDAEFRKAVEGGTTRNLAVERDKEKEDAPGQMFQIMQMCERNLHYRKLLHDARILDAVQDLIGPNIMLFHDQALYKPARHGGPVHWHQDNAYWKCLPATLLSCWLTLDDVDKDNGAMQVIPGSHLRPVWHEDTNTPALIETKGFDKSKAVIVDLPAGGAMLHHCQTLHYTAPNTTDRQRRAFAIHFMPPGTRDRSGKVIQVSYGHPMLRMSM
jgi:ectoine hydroxylase-related dioxygenase (phytanoyl-CoA dioxygenase family)